MSQVIEFLKKEEYHYLVKSNTETLPDYVQRNVKKNAVVYIYSKKGLHKKVLTNTTHYITHF